MPVPVSSLQQLLITDKIHTPEDATQSPPYSGSIHFFIVTSCISYSLPWASHSFTQKGWKSLPYQALSHLFLKVMSSPAFLLFSILPRASPFPEPFLSTSSLARSIFYVQEKLHNLQGPMQNVGPLVQKLRILRQQQQKLNHTRALLSVRSCGTAQIPCF